MRAVFACTVAALFTSAAFAQIGLVDFDGTEIGLVSYSNTVVSGANTSASDTSANGITSYGPGDTFWPMSRDVLGPNGVGMPFSISDDSVNAAAGNTVFPGDTQGFADTALGGNGFFGVTDTVNGVGSNAEVATFVFDISGASNLGVSIDFAAMGDFEASGDFFNFDYSIDGAPFAPLFTSSINEDIDQSYTMDDGGTPVLADPALINGVLLNDVFQTISASIAGAGSELTIRFTGETDGGSEAFGFDNLTVTPEPASLVVLALGALAVIRRR